MILTLVWLLVVLLLSIIPAGGTQTGFPADKIIHFIIYGITAIIFFRVLSLKMSPTRSIILSLSLASFYGLSMELLQSALPWRECSFSDAVANISGALFFGIIYAVRTVRGKKLNVSITTVYKKDDREKSDREKS